MYKRFEMRRSAGVPIEVISNKSDLPLDFISWDLSPGGAYLMSDAIPTIGEQLVCSFHIDDARSFCFFSEVTRINRGRRACDTGPPGFGVRFMDPTPRDRLAIRGALHGLPPSLPTPRRDNQLTRAMGWN
jgi:hypothetical protein